MQSMIQLATAFFKMAESLAKPPYPGTVPQLRCRRPQTVVTKPCRLVLAKYTIPATCNARFFSQRSFSSFRFFLGPFLSLRDAWGRPSSKHCRRRLCRRLPRRLPRSKSVKGVLRVRRPCATQRWSGPCACSGARSSSVRGPCSSRAPTLPRMLASSDTACVKRGTAALFSAPYIATPKPHVVGEHAWLLPALRFL